jgi:hypothetical protein
MPALDTTIRRSVGITVGAGAASSLIARAAFLLFVFLCVATTPGVGQLLVATVGPITEEHISMRELAPGGSERVEHSREHAVRGEAVPLIRRPQLASRHPFRAAQGHRLPNGLCAPLLF